MGLLVALIILLILAIVFFITSPIIFRKIVSKKYNVFCDKKVNKIATKNNFKILSNLELHFYNSETVKIDQVLFGKKYIYIFTNYYFDGDIKGTIDNNSWLFKKRGSTSGTYIDNISMELSRKNRVFSEKITANPELIIPIAIINNECEINVDSINNNNTFVIHFSYLKKLIKKLELRSVENLNDEQCNNIYESLTNENSI